MPLKSSMPQDLWLWGKGQDDLILGAISSDKAQDVFQVNVAMYLVGDFTNKKFTLTLTEGSRVYTSVNSSLTAVGRNLGYVSFAFEKFHSKIADIYEAVISIDDPAGIEFYGVGDWLPKTNTQVEAQQPPSVRVEFYGV